VKRLDPRVSDLADGLVVRRVLPQRARRAVGPFVFFDHFGPVEVAAGAGDVGPHPHIGLATVTYTFEGGFVHRDSLGNELEITPGAVNWMSAGRGVVHSERAPRGADGRAAARRLHGLQLWVALPSEAAESAPSFQHVAKSEIPELDADGAHVRVLVGEALGVRSPVRAASPTLYLDVELAAGATFAAGALAQEVAVYAPTDTLIVSGEELAATTMAVLEPGDAVSAPRRSSGRTRFVVIGGAAIEPVRMWWNFVARDAAAIEAAARRWESGGFDAVPGETERVAMPPFTPRLA
jgi:redox-sensitive bicupin YhaK (pirin superfamily)